MNRLLTIGTAAFIIASLAIFLLGDSGLRAMAGLATYRQSLAANVDALRERNQQLSAQLERLKADRETNVVLARDIGMYEPGDSVVVIAGRPQRPEAYAVGDLIRLRRPEPTRNAAFKEAALGAAALAAVFSLVLNRAARRKSLGSPRR